MTTACWGTNSSFDCAWVIFGYGSRYDMISDYRKGWWVSLDALKVLVKYDYKLSPDHIPDSKVIHNIYEPNWYNKERFIKEKMEDYAICEKYGNILNNLYKWDQWENGHVVFDEQKWSLLPPLLQMRTSAIHIDHPNAGEWFLELKKYSGLFIKENPDYKEIEYYNGGEREYESHIPFLKAIKNINYSDWEIISRVEYMNQQAMESEPEPERLQTGDETLHKFENAEDMFKELDSE